MASAGTARSPNKSSSIRVPGGAADLRINPRELRRVTELRDAAIAGHLQPLAAPRAGLGVVGEQRDQPRGAAGNRSDAMNRVAPFEQQQRSRMHRDAHHAFAGTLEQTLDARIVLVGGAAN